MGTGEWVLYIIGLKRRLDRRRRIERNLRKASVPCEIRFASDLDVMVDWCDLTPESVADHVYRNWNIGGANPWWNRPLKLGEIACSLSHLNVWSLANRSGHGAVILEDDAVLKESFGDDLQHAIRMGKQVDPNWGLLYLGRERLEADSPSRLPGLVSPGHSYCSYGYCLSVTGLRSVLTAGFADEIIPVDEFLPSTFLKHPRADIAARFPPRLSAYALTADIVDECGSLSEDSDTERSPFAS